MTTDPHVLHDGHAPTPFTADEIRRGCPVGRTVTTRTETDEGVETSVSRFVECDEEGARFESVSGSRRVSWLDLQEHASFPAEITEIAEEDIETPLGRLDCLRYRVEREGQTHTFWFDKERPGMPVMVTVVTDGHILSTSTVVADTRP